MSAVSGFHGYEMDASDAADDGRDRERITKRGRHTEYRRQGSAPTRVNGIRCRRHTRWNRGSGRGARMAYLRAFAGCLAVALSLAAGAAQAAPVGMSFLAVGNPGNAGNVLTSGTYGAVASTFYMSQFETTNAQYVQLLNAVGSGSAASALLYNTSMGTDPNGGITRSGAPGSYTYAVRSGSNPAGVAYENVPVNFTNWFAAARYVNWLSGSMQTGAAGVASMEGGFAGSAYNLAGKSTGTIVARNANAKYFLPSINEFYKASFYNGTGYNTWATSSGTTTPASANTPALAGNPNVATYGNTSSTPPTTAPLAVNSFTASTSPYGLYGMLGNISEYTDTPNGAGSPGVMSGSWGTLVGNIANFSSTFGPTATPAFIGSTTQTSQIGFRVASNVAPVPEPATITLAALGVVGLCGANWMRRRRRPAAATEPALVT